VTITLASKKAADGCTSCGVSSVSPSLSILWIILTSESSFNKKNINRATEKKKIKPEVVAMVK
jgi:hypothetical protein